MKLKLLGACFAACVLTACGGSDSNGARIIDPNDANAVADTLGIKVGELTAQQREGDPPAATTTGSEPVLSTDSDQLDAINGAKVNLNFQADSADAITALFIKVVGSDSFLEFDLGGSTKASLAENIEFTLPENIGDGTFCAQISVSNAGGFVSQPKLICITVESTADDEPEPPAPIVFSANFASDRAFYIDGIEGTGLFDGDFIALFQYTFRGDGTATELWSPSEENAFSTSDTYVVTWEVDAEGRLVTRDTDEDGTYTLELSARSITADSATYDWVLSFTDPNGTELASDSGRGSMQAADPAVYAFAAGRVFDVDAPESDIETLTFNADGTGSVRFAPNPDNDFAQDDVNTLHWQALEGDRLVYTEFAGDGYDREQTGCEDNPNIDCSLDPTSVELDFTSLGADTASFDFEATSSEGNFNSSGSMSAQGTQAH